MGRIEDGARMAIKGQRPRMSAQFPCTANGFLEDAPMAKMDAVKEARRENYGGLAYGVQSVDDAHGRNR